MSNPFRYFNSSPEVIRLVVMMYVRYLLSLRNVGDLLAERGIDLSHETVRFWWNRFGPIFAVEIRKRHVTHMRGYPLWRWHLDEAFVKINGKLCYLWRAIDHEGQVLEAVVTTKRDKAAALKLLKRVMKKYGRPRIIVTDRLRAYSAAMVEIGVADRHEVGRPSQQSGREFASAVSATRTGDAALSKSEDTRSLAQFMSRCTTNSIKSATSSRGKSTSRDALLPWPSGAPRGIDRRSRDGGRAACRRASVTLTPPSATLPLGSVGYENATNERGERLIWLDHAVVARLRAMRGPRESYSDVILRIAAQK
jgi:transposase-like protein